jgi:hypothetical protein
MFYSINTGCNLPVNNPLNYTKGNTEMTQNQFIYLCNESNIEPALALENDNIVAAIKAGDIEMVQFLLDNEF